MSERSSLEAVWAEIHSFTVDQNSRSASKTRSNRRSISLTLPITLLLAIIILMGSWLWLWLLGGGVLWLLYKILNDDYWTVSSWRRQKTSSRIQSARPAAAPRRSAE
jgi:hypothetical protein